MTDTFEPPVKSRRVRKFSPEKLPDDIDLFSLTGYEPSLKGAEFHDSPHRFRYLLWGIKSGKTFAGAHEFVWMVIQKALETWGRRENVLAWVVAPTHLQLTTCERELDIILQMLADAGVNILSRKWQAPNVRYRLIDGSEIELRSGDKPNNLRGPNVDCCWVDEAAFVKEDAWNQIKGRISVRKGEVICTTTPDGRNWVWRECCEAGMPKDSNYGEFQSDEKDRWVSHRPTWEFPWVDQEYVDDCKRTMARSDFDRDIAAKFLASGKQVFRFVEESYHSIPLPRDNPPKDKEFILGIDLAKSQDFSVIIVMDGSGIIWDIMRWSGLNWKIQKDRIVQAHLKWGGTCVVDSANVGSVVCDDLRHRGVNLREVSMHSPQVKKDIIEALQDAFDARSGAIQVPNPLSELAPEWAQELADELKAYEQSTTPRGAISYSAPKGSFDDLVIGVALAYWGVKRGLGGQAVTAETVSMGRNEFERYVDQDLKNLANQARRRKPRGSRGSSRPRRGIFGGTGGGFFWR